MRIEPASVIPADIGRYAGLFSRCFPGAGHLDAAYLDWLYGRNPSGAVVGMDAWDGETLAAHYACIPVEACVRGERTRVLLSLNTATDPDYQGRGLFTTLAQRTYEAGAAQGFSAVYGVANANSTPGFLKKLGFALVSPLDAKVGLGTIDPRPVSELLSSSEFRRVWTAESLRWRASSPARPYAFHRGAGGWIGASTKTGKPGLRAWADVFIEDSGPPPALAPAPFAAKLHIGLRPAGARGRAGVWMDVPDRFRASPLNLIFRALSGDSRPPDKDAVLFGQLDFDAF